MAADGHMNDLDMMTTLELDLQPFNTHFPLMSRPKSIGNGVSFLNR